MLVVYKSKDLLEYQPIVDWISTYNKKDNLDYVRRVIYYLRWRKITIEELMQSQNEEEFFELFVAEFTAKDRRSYGISITTVVRSFLRFIGCNVKTKHRLKENWYFETDPIMVKFLKLFRAKATKKGANIALNDYCQFRNTTPSKLLEEDSNEVDLMFSLLDFKDYLLQGEEILEQTAWRKVNTIRKFYRNLKQIRIEFDDSVKPKPLKRIYATTREEMITKEEMIKMLEVADVRDSLIILGLWETGLNTSDLTKITYGQLKAFLDLEEPDNVPEGAIFKHIRSKYPIEFFCGIGKQTLKYASLWLKQRTAGVLGAAEKLTDKTIIFSTKIEPYTQPNHRTINNITKRISELAAIRKLVPTDFRNTFYSKLTETGMDKDTREMLMGHTLGIAGHYSISQQDYYLLEYLKYFDICFDLNVSNERILSLEEENKEVKTILNEVTNILEQLGLSLLDPENETTFSREDFLRTLAKLRKMR